MLTRRTIAGAVALLCLLRAATLAAEEPPVESPKAALHRVSVGVAPVHYGSYIGDFGRDNPPVSDSIFRSDALGTTISARYTYSLLLGVDIGADVGLIKPYYTGHDGNPDMRKLTHPWLAALLRASVWVSDSTDLAFSGRLGVAQPFWDDRASSLVVVYGAGPEIRHWVSQQIAVGGELDVARAQLELGERGTDSGVHANGLVVSPSVRITWAL